jgi:hypothetical protein
MSAKSSTSPEFAATPFERLRRNVKSALSCAEEGRPDIDTLDAICCALSRALSDLEDLEVVTDFKAPAANDGKNSGEGFKVYRGGLSPARS